MVKGISSLSLLFFLLTTEIATAQKIVVATTPEAVGFSSERLKRIDANLKSLVNKEWINGAVALVIRNGKIVYYKSTGYKILKQKHLLQRMAFSELHRRPRLLPVWRL